MAWHKFKPGGIYPTLQVLAECWNRLQSGAVAEVADKVRLLELIRRVAPEQIVYTPFSTGWGASPLNPNCWKDPGGGTMLHGVTVAEPAGGGDL